MGSAMSVSGLAVLQAGDHVCWLHGSPGERGSAPAKPVRQEANRGEGPPCILEQERQALLRRQTRNAATGPPLRPGSPSTAAREESHLIDGRFPPDRTMTLPAEQPDRALADEGVGLPREMDIRQIGSMDLGPARPLSRRIRGARAIGTTVQITFDPPPSQGKDE